MCTHAFLSVHKNEITVCTLLSSYFAMTALGHVGGHGLDPLLYGTNILSALV